MSDWPDDDREQEYQERQERERYAYESEERGVEEWKNGRDCR